MLNPVMVSFLKNFTKELIFHSKKEKKYIIEIDKNKIKEVFSQNQLFSQVKERLKEESFKESVKKEQMTPTIKTTLPKKHFKHPSPATPLPTPSPKTELKKIEDTKNQLAYLKAILEKEEKTTQVSGIDALENLIKNPTVKQIICEGENQPILIKKNFAIIKTNITLTKKEIDSLLEYFAEQARIPLINGVFKVKIKNLKIIAYKTEKISKFMIVKNVRDFY